ncbi:MAG: hypothetical protein ACFB4I_22415 [Cyanophyceae cyanobacterium]
MATSILVKGSGIKRFWQTNDSGAEFLIKRRSLCRWPAGFRKRAIAVSFARLLSVKLS